MANKPGDRTSRILSFRIRLEHTLRSLHVQEYVFLYLLAALIGVGGGFGAILFRWLIGRSHALFLVSGQAWLNQSEGTSLLFPLLPALGGLGVGLLTYFLAREAKGHGVPEVMAAVAEEGGVIRPRVTIVKTLASAICIGSGGSVGREGPIVQIGSAWGSSMGQFFRISKRRLRMLVACGAAAGISATFNAPIGGLLFALEIILGDFTIRAFTPIIIASVLADVVTRAFLGNEPAFLLPTYQLVHPFELAHYVVLGVLLGAVAVVFTRGLYKMEDLFDAIPIPEYLKPVLGGLLLGLMGLFVPRTFYDAPAFFGVGYEAITQILTGQLPVVMVALYFVLKLAATTLTLGSGGSGGIFAPSLFLGATVGMIFGHGVHALLPELTAAPGAYGLVGMGAVVGGATHAPLTASLILFELTGNYAIILPLLLATGISSVVANLIERDSIYTLKLTRRGLRIHQAPDIAILEQLRVQEALTTEFETVTADTPMCEIVDLFSNSRYHEIPVLDGNASFLGMIHLYDIRPVLFDRNVYSLLIASDLLTVEDAALVPSESLADALTQFNIEEVSELPVVDENDPSKLVGVLSRAGLMRRYHEGIVAHQNGSDR